MTFFHPDQYFYLKNQNTCVNKNYLHYTECEKYGDLNS